MTTALARDAADARTPSLYLQAGAAAPTPQVLQSDPTLLAAVSSIPRWKHPPPHNWELDAARSDEVRACASYIGELRFEDREIRMSRGRVSA
jgi:hypothetical protein